MHMPVSRSRVIDKTPFFYGWVILTVGTITSVMIGPSQTFTFGLFVDAYVNELDLSRSQLSLFYGIATLTAALLLPLMGRLTDRFGARSMILWAAAGLGLACWTMGQVQGLLVLMIGMVALRFFGFGSLQLVSNHVIAQWFIRRRGLAMGLAGQSLAIGLLVFPPLGEALIDQLGWRNAWVAFGILVILIVIPIGWLFFRNNPEQYGRLPDGEPNLGLQSGATAAEVNWTLAEAARTPIFWIFALGLGSMALAMAGIVFHQIALYAERGLSREVAIRAFQIIALFSVAGNLGMGRLLDRYSGRKLLVVALLILVVALYTLQIMSTIWQATLCAALLGIVSGSFRVLDATVWAKYFGRRHLGSIRGATMIGSLGATALGAFPLGLSYDRLGSFNPALTAIMLLPLILAAIALLIRRPEKVLD